MKNMKKPKISLIVATDNVGGIGKGPANGELSGMTNAAKDKGIEIIRLTGADLTTEALTQALESPSLFAGQKTVVIEGLLSLRPSKLKDSLVELIANHQEQPLILWEGKSVTAANIKKLKTAKVQEFKIAPMVFKFLDTLALTALHQALKQEPAELIFYFLHRRLSQLIQVKDRGSFLKGAPWQIGKIKAQSSKYTLEQLIGLQEKLLQIDYRIKSGQDDLALASQLDLILVNF